MSVIFTDFRAHCRHFLYAWIPRVVIGLHLRNCGGSVGLGCKQLRSVQERKDLVSLSNRKLHVVEARQCPFTTRIKRALVIATTEKQWTL